jgi:hypothetical protein
VYLGVGEDALEIRRGGIGAGSDAAVAVAFLAAERYEPLGFGIMLGPGHRHPPLLAVPGGQLRPPIPSSEQPVAVTGRPSARYRHWPFRCCSSPLVALLAPVKKVRFTPAPSRLARWNQYHAGREDQGG